MIDYLLVAAGAAVGAPLRYLTDRLVQAHRNRVLPLGTLTVNLVGSLILGAVIAATLVGSTPTTFQVLLGTGFCGTLTTYSTFSYETVRLAQEHAHGAAITNTALSIFGGIASAAAGFAIVTAIAA